MRSVAEAFSYFFPQEQPDTIEPDLGLEPWFWHLSFPITNKEAKNVVRLWTTKSVSTKITHRTTVSEIARRLDEVKFIVGRLMELQDDPYSAGLWQHRFHPNGAEFMQLWGKTVDELDPPGVSKDDAADAPARRLSKEPAASASEPASMSVAPTPRAVSTVDPKQLDKQTRLTVWRLSIQRRLDIMHGLACKFVWGLCDHTVRERIRSDLRQALELGDGTNPCTGDARAWTALRESLLKRGMPPSWTTEMNHIVASALGDGQSTAPTGPAGALIGASRCLEKTTRKHLGPYGVSWYDGRDHVSMHHSLMFHHLLRPDVLSILEGTGMQLLAKKMTLTQVADYISKLSNDESIEITRAWNAWREEQTKRTKLAKPRSKQGNKAKAAPSVPRAGGSGSRGNRRSSQRRHHRRRRRGGGAGKGDCFNCGETGHFRQDCPKLAAATALPRHMP